MFNIQKSLVFLFSFRCICMRLLWCICSHLKLVTTMRRFKLDLRLMIMQHRANEVTTPDAGRSILRIEIILQSSKDLRIIFKLIRLDQPLFRLRCKNNATPPVLCERLTLVTMWRASRYRAAYTSIYKFDSLQNRSWFYHQSLIIIVDIDRQFYQVFSRRW